MRIFQQPFAISGDRVEVPNAAQPSGSVSLAQGYGADYSRDPDTDPQAKRIERLAFNGILYDVTDALIMWQRGALPEWSAGVAYRRNAMVVTGADAATVYISLLANNSAALTDVLAWREVSLAFPTNTRASFVRAASNTEATAGVVSDAFISPASLAAALAASTAVVPSSRSVAAGVGLTGGGTLAANRTIALGTPSTLTGATTNAVTGTTHAHEISLAVADVAGAAPLASPAFTGNPTAPTQLTGDTSTRVATTAFVKAAIAAGGGGFGALAYLNSVDNSNWSGTPLSPANGGTGQTTLAGVRTWLGLGTMAFANGINNGNWSGSALSLANGGTGATTAADARNALGLGAWATRGDTATGRATRIFLGTGTAAVLGDGSNNLILAADTANAVLSAGGIFSAAYLSATSGAVFLGSGINFSWTGATFNFNGGGINIPAGNVALNSAGRVTVGGQTQGKTTVSTAAPSDYANVAVGDIWFQVPA